MATLSQYERNNAIVLDVDTKKGGVLTDPSGNKMFIDIIMTDGTYYTQNATTGRTGTGEFSYYFAPSSNNPLGLWVAVWHGLHNAATVGGVNWGYLPIWQRYEFEVVHAD